MRRCVQFRILPGLLATLLATSMGSAQQLAPSGKPSALYADGAANTGAKPPKIIEVQVRAPLQGDAKGAGFTLAILGENLCTPGEKPAVEFLVNGKTTEAAKSTQCESPTELLASGELAAPFEITEVRLVLPGSVVRSKGYKVSIRPNPPAPKLNEFQIKFEHQKNKEFPNLHSVVVTKESGEPGIGFDVNPNHMQIELVPTGATDIRVAQSNEQQMDLHFIAAADYEPTEVIVTVFSSSDLDHRQPTAVAKPFQEKKPATDPDQPTISGVDLLFLERSQGRGRVRITGKGFGTYDAPPYPVDEYLKTHLQSLSIKGTDPNNLKTLQRECGEAVANAAAYKTLVRRYNAINSEEKGETAPPAPTTSHASPPDTKPCDPEDTLKDKEKSAQLSTEIDRARETLDGDKWPEWQNRIRKAVNITLTDRNPDIRIDKIAILNINDQMIDVYFEFTRARGYSEPLRLKEALVTLLKPQIKTTQTEKGASLTATVTGASVKAYSAQKEIGPDRSADLTFDYTVLDEKQANVMLGKGISQHFYVLKISVVNNGTKKVSVPLAAIQAEVEWARGHEGSDSSGEGGTAGGDAGAGVDYLEGAPTVTPSPLGAVSAFFDAYNKNHGKRAIFFNAIDALTVAGAALVPYTGPSFKDAQVFWSGGFVPAMHKGLGDISGQQLQNLTSLSWQNSETLPPQGGSLMKLIYIQKSPQFSNVAVTLSGKKKQTKKVITNLLNLDITGYEVTESEAKQATQQPEAAKEATPVQANANNPAAASAANPPTNTTEPPTSKDTGKKTEPPSKKTGNDKEKKKK